MAVAHHRWAVAGLVCLVGLAAWIGAIVAQPAPEPQTEPPRWVRTRSGWQVAHWEQPRVAHQPRLHPLVVAAFIGLASAAALVSFSGRKKPSGSPSSPLPRAQAGMSPPHLPPGELNQGTRHERAANLSPPAQAR